MSVFDAVGDAMGGLADRWLDHTIEQIEPPQHNPTPEATAGISSELKPDSGHVEQPTGTVGSASNGTDARSYMVPALIGGGFILLVLIAAVGGRK